MQEGAWRNLSYDISVDAEKNPIYVICREDTLQGPQPFEYIRNNSHCGSFFVDLNQGLGLGAGCTKCVSACGVGRSSCCCAFSAGGLAPYTREGLLHPHYIEMVRHLYGCTNVFLKILFIFRFRGCRVIL